MTQARPLTPRRPLAWPGRLGLHLVLLAGALVMIYPLLWMVSSSLKPDNLIFTNLSLWPKEFRFRNYVDGWSGGQVSFAIFFLNSLIVSVASIIGNLISCSMAAYSFARLRFKFRKAWFAVMLVAIMLPFHVTVVPQFVMFRSIGWVNTFLPLVVPKFLAVDAFFIFLMVQFIRGIPRELDEAAAVDGASPVEIYWRIILPLMTPALVTTAIFTFIWTWNDFFTHLIYLNDLSKYTVSLGLRMFVDAQGASAWGPMFAMSTLSLLPVFVVFLLFQRLLVEGIATTGIKG